MYLPNRLTVNAFLTTLLVSGSWAAEPSAYVAYDVMLREFVCWTEGTLPATRPAGGVCSEPWRPVTGDTHFVRGQAISIVLVNAKAIDIFQPDVSAADLQEPGLDVLGDFATLPKVVPLPPGPTLIPGPGVAAFSAASAAFDPDSFYRLLGTASEKDFKAWLKDNLTDPLNAKEIQDLLATIQKGTIGGLKTERAEAMAEAQAIAKELSTDPARKTTAELVAAVRRLAGLIERQRALRDRTIISGLSAHGKQAFDLAKALRSLAVSRALSVDQTKLGNLLTEMELAFPPGARYSRIEKIEVDAPTKSYVVRTEPEKTEMAELLKRINADDGGDADAAGLARVKANLTAAIDSLPDLRLGKDRLARLKDLETELVAYGSALDNAERLQEQLDKNASATIVQARTLNEAARTQDLDAALTHLPLGTWYGSKELTITLKQGQRFPLFDLGGTVDTVRTEVQGLDNPPAKAAQTPASDLAVTRTIKIRIYNTYRFQLGLGFAYSTAPDDRFQVAKQTTGSGATATTVTYIDQVRSRDYNLLYTVDLMVFPTARTNFPWKARYPGERRPGWYRDIGGLLAFSLTSPSKDFLFGGVYMPRRSPVGFKAGWHLALRDYPPEGIGVGQPLTDRTVVLSQTRKNGFFAGLTFSTDFFAKVFAPIFKP